MTLSQKATVATIVCVLSIVVGRSFASRTVSGDNEQQSQAKLTADLLHLHRTQTGRIQVAVADLAKADGTIAKLKLRAPALKARAIAAVAAIQVDTAPPHLEAFDVAPGDTTHLSRIRREKVDPRDYVVPTFMVDAWRNAVEWAQFMDTLVVQYKERDARAGILISALDHQLETDSSIIASQRAEIGWWQRKHHARCGRRCGIAIGVGGTVLAAIAVKSLQDVLDRDHHGAAVYSYPYRAP